MEEAAMLGSVAFAWLAGSHGKGGVVTAGAFLALLAVGVVIWNIVP
jgi:hypothetical protein